MDMLWLMDNFWDPIVSAPLVLGLLGIRVKARNFKYVVFAALITVCTARAIHGNFDTVTLSFGIVASISTMFILRDKSIKRPDRALDEEESVDTVHNVDIKAI